MKKDCLVVLFVMCMALLASAGSYQALASTFTNETPYKVILKMEIDRETMDIQQVVHQVAEIIKEEIESSSGGFFKVVTSNDGMEPTRPIEILHFPPAQVNGMVQYAAQVEVWSDKDNQFVSDFGGKYAVGGPWNVAVFSTPDMADMLKSVDTEGSADDGASRTYVMVSIINPRAVSKVAYRDLPYRENFVFNFHCSKVLSRLNKSIVSILRKETDYKWQYNSNPIYNGLPITNKDVESLADEEINPAVTIPYVDPDTIADAYTDYVRSVAPRFKPGGDQYDFGRGVQVLFNALFTWMDPSQPFDCDLTPYGLPIVHFDNFDDFKVRFPEMVNEIFVPKWRANLPTQGWKYVRRFREGMDGEVNLVEMCNMFYAGMATGTGFHHAPALPCMLGFYPVGSDSQINMFSAKATFMFYFKDASVMMKVMNMPIQSFMFERFPDMIFYEMAALVNGALDNLGVSGQYFFEIKEW